MGLALFGIGLYVIPLLVIYGFPLIGMYIWFPDGLLKFWIVYTSRYFGLAFHVISVLMGAILGGMVQGDNIWPIINLIATFFLEKEYTKYGGEAVKHIDSSWTQGESHYPFAV